MNRHRKKAVVESGGAGWRCPSSIPRLYRAGLGDGERDSNQTTRRTRAVDTIRRMRQIGTIPNEQWMQRLADYLFTLGIRIQAEPAQSGFAVWAIDEDRVTQARDELARFVQNPEDERYKAAEREARRLREQLVAREKERQKNVVDVRSQWRVPRTKPVTFFLISASCVVALV